MEGFSLTQGEILLSQISHQHHDTVGELRTLVFVLLSLSLSPHTHTRTHTRMHVSTHTHTLILSDTDPATFFFSGL